MAHALKLLRHRARSRHELELALGRKGFDASAIEATLHRLGELGYLDDSRFARARAASLLRDGRLGEVSVRQRLLAHGLPEEEADAALRDAKEEVGFDPLASARTLLERRGLWGKPLGEREQARAARFLSARGFSEDDVDRILKLANALETTRQGG